MVTLDKFGVTQIYPTRNGGDKWFLGDKPVNSDPRLVFAGNFTSLLTKPNSMFEPDDHTQVRLIVIPSVGYLRPVGGCDMNFSDAMARGYTGLPGGWGSVEFTVFLKVVAAGNLNGVLDLDGPTDEHLSSPCAMGKAYKSHISLDNPVRSILAKEMYHDVTTEIQEKILKDFYGANYDLSIEDLQSRPDVNTFGGIFGLKHVIILNQGGENNFVKVEQYINISGDKITWTKINEKVDSGGWGTGGDLYGGNPDQIFNLKAGTVRFGYVQPSNAEIEVGYMSVREITDGTDPPTFPLPPVGTTNFVRIIDVKYHLGLLPTGACGFGSPGGLTPVYDVNPTGNSQSNLHRERYRVGIIANNVNSEMVGIKPRRVTTRLSKSSTPPDEPVTLVMRKGTDDTVAINFELVEIAGSPAGPELTAADLTTSIVDYTFENLDHNYTWVVGDRLLIEYSGNTEDTTNEVNVHRNTSNPFDGGNTTAIKFDVPESGTSFPPVSYGTPDTERDYAWIIYV